MRELSFTGLLHYTLVLTRIWRHVLLDSDELRRPMKFITSILLHPFPILPQSNVPDHVQVWLTYFNFSKIYFFFVFHENPFLIDIKSWIYNNQSLLGPAPINLLDGLLYEQNYLSQPTYFFSYRPIGLNTFTFSISPSFR